MKPPKKPSEEPSLPSQDESRRTNVLFEKLMSEFRTFGEGQSDLRERVGKIESKLDKQGEDIEVLKAAARTQGADIRSIKSDVAEIKADLKNYNQRIEVVETKVAS